MHLLRKRKTRMISFSICGVGGCGFMWSARTPPTRLPVHRTVSIFSGTSSFLNFSCTQRDVCTSVNL